MVSDKIGIDMRLDMMNREERFVVKQRKRLGTKGANKKRAR